MATARKLPSGRYRVLVYIGVDDDGKKKYKSFTADTKHEAEMEASQYLNDPSRETGDDRLTVKDAIERYINAKTGVLSPSTVHGYRILQRNRYTSIEKLKVSSLTTEDMQKFVSDTAQECSPKTTANAYGLLSSSVTMFRPDVSFHVTLPKRIVKKQIAPSNESIQALFDNADDKMKTCIALAAFCSMRRGEICALKYGDISGNNIYIHADMVSDENNVYQYKDMPKTSESVRTVTAPNRVIEMLGHGEDDEYVLGIKPYTITKGFIRLRNSLGMSIRFHDLRHYYASIGAALGIPDIYMSDFGGWRRGSPVLKETYQNVIEDMSEKYSKQLNNHFDNMLNSK